MISKYYIFLAFYFHACRKLDNLVTGRIFNSTVRRPPDARVAADASGPASIIAPTPATHAPAG